MTEIRNAVVEDVPWLLSQIAAFEKFAGYKKKLLENEYHALQVLAKMMADHIVLVAVSGPIRQGFVAGLIANHPLNPNIVTLSEVFWWVPEEHRHTRAGAMLLDAFDKEGDKAGWVIFSLEHNSPVRQEHLTKRGYRCVERAFLREV